MFKKVKLTDSLYYVGVNDRTKVLFENMWPLPYGVSYNSYLIIDEKTALIDTVDTCYSEEFLQKIETALEGRSLDYLIINHMEPDHSGSLKDILRVYPYVTLVGNGKTFDMTYGFYGIKDHTLTVKNGDNLSLGRRNLHFYLTPMVHWPETMMTYDATDLTLFAGDAFGCFRALNGGILDKDLDTSLYYPEMIRYYANIVGKYGSPVQKALKKLASLEIKTICSTHGPVWQKEIGKVVSIYDKLSKYEAEDGVVIIYGSMYGNTAKMAEAIATELSACGIKHIAVHNVTNSHSSYILEDIFRYKGVIIGSPTYNTALYPEVDSILKKIENREIKNRYFGYFGSFSWANGASKQFSLFSERIKWEVIGTPIENKMGMNSDSYEACESLAKAMAEKLLNSK